MNIVIVENEGLMALFLKETVTALGHTLCDIFCNGEALIKYMRNTNTPIDLIFMDINIQGALDGIETSKKIADISSGVRIVFITSYKDSQTIQKAQYVKPSGYLIKPVSQIDIEAILMVVEGRIKKSAKNTVRLIDNFTYDMESLLLKNDKESIKLTSNELRCLQALIEAKNSYITKENLIESIWSGENGTNRSSSLRELIARLRKKIPNLPIENNYTLGYMLTLEEE